MSEVDSEPRFFWPAVVLGFTYTVLMPVGCYFCTPVVPFVILVWTLLHLSPDRRQWRSLVLGAILGVAFDFLSFAAFAVFSNDIFHSEN